jgi:hypothetical protein
LTLVSGIGAADPDPLGSDTFLFFFGFALTGSLFSAELP